jgi:hypothetical protein
MGIASIDDRYIIIIAITIIADIVIIKDCNIVTIGDTININYNSP